MTIGIPKGPDGDLVDAALGDCKAAMLHLNMDAN